MQKFISFRNSLHAVGIYLLCLIAVTTTEAIRALSNTQLSIWLASGVVLAAAIAAPRKLWWIWAIAAISAEVTGNFLWYGHDLFPAFFLAFGNTIAALVSAFALRKFVPNDQVLTSLRSAAIFLVVACILMPAISATTGSIALGISYKQEWYAAWLRLFLGDASGASTSAPLFLLLFNAAAPRIFLHSRRIAEAGALSLFFILFATNALQGQEPYTFLLIPPLLWAALSFRTPGAIAAITCTALFSILFTLASDGGTVSTSILTGVDKEDLQLFLIVISATGLLIGAIAEENRTGLKRLRSANQRLEQNISEKSADLATSEAQAREMENLLLAIGKACPELIYAKNLDFKIVYANDATLKVLGADNLAVLRAEEERDYYTLKDEFDPIRENDERVLREQRILVIEEQVTHASGETRIYRTTKSPLYDADGELSGLAGVSVDITDMKQAQARESMLVREVEHRARNLLAVVQSIAQLTKADTIEELKTKLGRRIRSLAQTNGAIAASDWNGASLVGILEAEISPYRDDARANVTIKGEDALLAPSTAQSLTLVIHELTTNAVKYGCLSNDSGKLSVSWDIKRPDDGQSILTLCWKETGGPPANPPQRRGFGTMMISVFGKEQAGSEVDFLWEPSGLTVNLKTSLPAIGAQLPTTSK